MLAVSSVSGVVLDLMIHAFIFAAMFDGPPFAENSVNNVVPRFPALPVTSNSLNLANELDPLKVNLQAIKTPFGASDETCTVLKTTPARKLYLDPSVVYKS